MGLRHKFEFIYSVSKLLPVCTMKAAHHRARENHYRNEFAKAEDDLKKNGIIMTEAAASIASGGVTGYGTYGRSLTPVVNQDKVQAVNLAKDKIQQHQREAQEYERYTRLFRVALSLDPIACINLDADDVIFFDLQP